MKSNIKLLIGMIIIVLGIIMTIIAFAMSTVVNKDAVLEKKKDEIIADYTQLTITAGTNVDLRNELSRKLDTYTNENYPQEHEGYITLLNNYQENIQTITDYTNAIDEKCQEDIEDARIDIMCKSYVLLYEEIINLYIANVTEYNNNIKNYNQSVEVSYEEFNMLQTEYIDFNKDNKYLGKPIEEE